MLGLGFSPGGAIHVSPYFVDWPKLPLPPGPGFEAVMFGVLSGKKE